MGRSEELNIDLKERFMNEWGKSLGAISKRLQAPRSTVQTAAWHSCVAEEKHKLSLAAERKLVRMVKGQPKTTKKQICNELEAAGRRVSRVHSQVCGSKANICPLVSQKLSGSRVIYRLFNQQ